MMVTMKAGSERRCHGVRDVTTAGVQSAFQATILQEARFLRRLQGPQWQPTGVVTTVSTATTCMIAVLLSIVMSLPPARAATMQVAHPPMAASLVARFRTSESEMNHHGWKLRSVPTPARVDRSKAPQHGTTASTTSTASSSLSVDAIGPPASVTVPPTTTITTGSRMTSDRISPGNRRRGKKSLTSRLSNFIPMTLNGSEITVAAPARRHGRSHHTGARNPDKIKLKQCEWH